MDVDRSSDLPYQLNARWRWLGVGLGSLILLVALSVLGLDDVVGFGLAVVFVVLGFVLIDTFYNSGVRVTDEGVEERSILVRSRVVEWEDVAGMDVPAGRVLRRPVLVTGDGERLSLYSLAFLSLGREREPVRVSRLRRTVDELAYEFYDDDEDLPEPEEKDTPAESTAAVEADSADDTPAEKEPAESTESKP
ncbi:PH domain-containing protein [Actinokineospora pegani]|uniref:PH domain-containing protein n=1 Tax=Actinokineospora pegani TaxID=2654637 RepID=UPI0012EA0720|nr:PH domain-containing protein [Actinokineospora pegani]